MRFKASSAAMYAQPEKVYVAVGDDLRDGLATLDWALKTWASDSISVIVLHAANRNSRDNIVCTPFGKLPASTVSDEVLRANMQYEQEKAHKLLTQFIAFCGEVKTEVLEMEISDEPIHKLIVDLISRHRITRFVMSLAFLRASSRRSKGAISGSFYIHRYKPSYCELHVVCCGKVVLLPKIEEAGLLVDEDDDQGAMATKNTHRMSSRGRLGTLFASTPTNCLTSERSGQGWPDWMMDSYYDQLVFSTAEEEVSGQRNASSPIGGAWDMMKIRREDQVKTYVERSREAEWAIKLCNQRAEELKGRIDDETAIRMGVEREVESAKQEIGDIRSDVEDAKKRLSEALDLQSDLSGKLRSASLERSRAESRLEAAAIERSEMVREIEDLRRQRDVLHRRIEFCRDKDAIGAAARLRGKLGFRRREFSGEEIRTATDGFSRRRRMSSVSGGGGDDDGQRGVYRGRIDRTTVAIELVGDDGLAREGFREKVNQLIKLQHPHVVAMLGFCLEPMCLVFEYMPGGNLEDLLSSTAPNKNSNTKNRVLHWSHRLRIATEICGGLRFLSSAEPGPIILGDLRPSNIFLGHNLLAKVHGLSSAQCHNQWQIHSYVRPFGHVLLKLLMKGDWAGREFVEEARVPGSMTLSKVLDAAAGDWPHDVLTELAEIGMRCLHVGQGPENDLDISSIREELNALRKKALNLDEREPSEAANQEGAASMEDTSNVPSMFLCPIRQKVMRDPHVAADGFSYEKEAIEEWMGKGKNTSPMTNLRLNHTVLTPNHTLRPLIHEWIDKKMATPP